MRIRYHDKVRAVSVTVTGKERKPVIIYLLSNDVKIMGSLRLEGAVVGPQINGGGDASNTPFVNLGNPELAPACAVERAPSYHVRCFCTRDGELQVGIFLPVSEQQGEFSQEPIVDVSDSCYGLRIGVAIDSTLQRLGTTNKLLPRLEVVRVVGL
jgi:hypothetical protein